MRWMLLLLLVLNAFYYVWHQQQVPLRSQSAAIELRERGRQDIKLLSESASVRTEVRSSLSEGESAVCLFLGEFEEGDQALVVEQRLVSLDVQASVREANIGAGVDYWVYLSPLASRQASLRQLRELQARQIDSYVITEGDLADGISLGIFPRSESAVSVMDRLRAAGYEPKLRELERAHRSFWVRVAPASRRLIDDALLGRLVLDFPGLRHQMMPCDSVAP